MVQVLLSIYGVGVLVVFVVLAASGRTSGKVIGALIWPLLIPFLFSRRTF